MHRNVKQYLGLEDPQNGWWRRAASKRCDKRAERFFGKASKYPGSPKIQQRRQDLLCAA